MSAGGSTENWQHQALTVYVFGASGDLAKKKTFPSLFDLFLAGFLPPSTVICGYARSAKSDEEFRSHLQPFLRKRNADEARLAEFLQAFSRARALIRCESGCIALGRPRLT